MNKSAVQVPDTGVGEGVPHEPLPHTKEKDRDGPPTLPHGKANQNLVPKQVSKFINNRKFWSLFDSLCGDCFHFPAKYGGQPLTRQKGNNKGNRYCGF